MQTGAPSGSKSQNKVPIPDQQVALALLLELAVQRGAGALHVVCRDQKRTNLTCGVTFVCVCHSLHLQDP